MTSHSEHSEMVQLNLRIARIVGQQKLVPTEVLRSLLQQCNRDGKNLGQRLVRDHYLKMSDFAQIIQQTQDTATVKDAAALRPGSQSVGLGGKNFGPYQIIGEIARGGMGVVYRARIPEEDRVVALKILLTGASATTPQIKRFIREAKATAALQHSNIIPIYASGQEQGYHYFTMRCVTGGSFKKIIENSLMSLQQKLTIFIKVSRALAYAHRQQIIHRDIKPSNILLDHDGEPYLADFGLAKFIDSSSALTQTGSTIGTPFYMAPEQISGSKKSSKSSDIYSMGVMLYQLLTGSLPFRAENMVQLYAMISDREPPSIRNSNPDIPPVLETICLKAMEKKSKYRYASADALADDLEKFCRGERVKVRRSVFPRIKRYYRRHQTQVYGLGSVLVVIMLLLLGWHWYRETGKKQLALQAGMELQIERARQIFARDSGQATRMLEKLLHQLPQSYRLCLELGNCYQKQEQIAKACLLFDRALRLAPDHPEVLYAKSVFHYHCKEYPIALQLIDRYLKQHPRLSPGYRHKAEILRKLGQSQAAQECLRRANQLQEQKIQGAFAAIESQAQKQDTAALTALHDFIRRYPDYARAYRLRARLYYCRKQRQEALQDIARAIELDPRGEYYRCQGDWLFQSGYYQQAAASWRQAIKRDAGKMERLQLQRSLATVAMKLANYQRAYQLYQSLINSGQQTADLYLQAGAAAYHARKYAAAAKHLQQALSDRSLPAPLKGESLYYLGLLAEKKQRTSTAIKLWTRAIACHPRQQATLYSLLGQTCYRLNQYRLARKYLQSALQLRPDSAKLLWLSSCCHRHFQDNTAAIAAISRSIELEPWNHHYYFLRGQLYSKLDDLSKAEKDFFCCLRLNPSDLQPFFSILENTFARGIPEDFQKLQVFIGNLSCAIANPAQVELFASRIASLSASCIRESLIAGQQHKPKAKPENKGDTRQYHLFVKSLISSESPAVHSMAYTALLARYRQGNLRRFIRETARKSGYPASIRRRLEYIRDCLDQRFLDDEKVHLRHLLARYYSGSDHYGLLQLFHKGEDGIHCLAGIMSDQQENPIIRYWAALALFDLRQPHALRLLREKLATADASTQVLAAIALGKPHEIWRRDIAKLPQTFIRYIAVSKAAAAATPQQLALLLSDPKIEVRLAAAAWLRPSGNPEAETVLISGFTHAIPEIRAYAVAHYWDLLSVYRQQALKLFVVNWSLLQEPLEKMAPGKQIPRIFANAEIKLGRKLRLVSAQTERCWYLYDQQRQQTYLLVKELVKERRMVAVYRITAKCRQIQNRTRANLSKLEQMLNDSNAKVRRIALVRIQEIADNRLDHLIKKRLQDADVLVRFLAVNLLAAHNPAAVKSVLLDSNQPLFIRCAMVMGGITRNIDKNSIVHWMSAGIQLRNDPDVRIRMSVALFMDKALGTQALLEKRRVPFSLNLRRYQDPDLGVRLGRLLALIFVLQDREATTAPAQKAYEICREMLNDSQKKLRIIATFGATILSEYHRLKCRDQFYHWLCNHGSQEMRQGAAMGYLRLFHKSVKYSQENISWDESKMYRDFIAYFIKRMSRFREERHHRNHEKGAQSQQELRQCLSRALYLLPGDPKALFELGLLHYLKRDYRQSVAYIKKAIAVAPDLAIAKVWLAKVYFDWQKYDQSWETAEQAYRQAPWNAKLCHLRYQILLHQGKTQQAQRQARRLELLTGAN